MSKINSYLRLAMMFGDDHAHSFITNLEKMIEVVLFEIAPKGMLVNEIMNNLHSQYSLDFADVEIIRSIEGTRGSNNIVCINPEVKRVGDKKYTLTEATVKDLENRDKKDFIAAICEQFLIENPDIPASQQIMSDLIQRYFYRCFNSSAKTIMQLLQLDYKGDVLLSDDDLDADFTDDEKDLVNCFIYWDNAAKDKFVYQMVSCCFDYGTMTAKKDESEYENLFKEKNFVLDTNIIFRAVGINKDDRKQIIDAFIEKCKKTGIKLIVTNITRCWGQKVILKMLGYQYDH